MSNGPQTSTLRPRRQAGRTTTGCLTCRQRHVKCDEAKPCCKRCLRAAVDCSYGLRLRWPRQGAKMGNNRTRRLPARGDASSHSRSAEHCRERQTPLTTFLPSWDESLIHEIRHSTDLLHSSGLHTHVDENFAKWVDLELDQSYSSSAVNSAWRETNDICRFPMAMLEHSNVTVTSLSDIPEHTSTIEGMGGRPKVNENTSLTAVAATTFSLSRPPLCHLNQFPNMTGEDNMLFHYYVTEMCPKCVVRNGYNNNYRQVVLPLADRSAILIKAILAVTANRVRLQDGRFQTIALHHQAAVLRGLQQALNAKKRTSFSRLEILSTILMLCFYEIYSPDSSSVDTHGQPIRPWQSHSGGVRKVLEQGSLEIRDSRYERGIVSFCSQYFASRSVLTYTTLSPLENQDELIDTAQYWLKVADRPASEINPFAGCSNEMLKLILIITSRLRQLGQSSFQTPPKSEHLWADMMVEQLSAIKQHMPKEDSNSHHRHHDAGTSLLGDQSKSILEKTCEAFRLAALILLGNLYPNSHLEAQERRDMYIEEMSQILKSGVSLPRRGKLGYSSYAWPYLIACSHLRTPHQQASLRPLIKTLLSRDELESPHSETMSDQICRVLEDVWSLQNEEGEHRIILEGYDNGGIFLWESVMLQDHQFLEWV